MSFYTKLFALIILWYIVSQLMGFQAIQEIAIFTYQKRGRWVRPLFISCSELIATAEDLQNLVEGTIHIALLCLLALGLVQRLGGGGGGTSSSSSSAS